MRKDTLQRLISINQRIGFPKDSPEKTLISRYYIKQKYVQVLLDTSSFSNTKTLKATMQLATMLFNNLQDDDVFGLKQLKNGFNAFNSANEGAPSSDQVSSHYLEDVIVLESKRMNSSVKRKYLNEFTNSLQAHIKSNNQMMTGPGSSKYGAERTKQM